jgi:hypothetical protein
MRTNRTAQRAANRYNLLDLFSEVGVMGIDQTIAQIREMKAALQEFIDVTEDLPAFQEVGSDKWVALSRAQALLLQTLPPFNEAAPTRPEGEG